MKTIVGRTALGSYLHLTSDQLAGLEQTKPLPPADALLGGIPMWNVSTIESWKAS